MRSIVVFLSLSVLLLMSCTSENPSPKCGIPTAENFIVGEFGAECTMVEEGSDWSNNPGTVSRLNCLRIIKSDFVNYDEQVSYSIILSIAHSEGQGCDNLSPDAIKVGRYTLAKDNQITDPGEAGISVSASGELQGSWFLETEQNANAYFEVTSVEDVPEQPGWELATYFKRVRGKVNCLAKNPRSSDPPIEIKDVEFSIYMVY